jgi:two-component system, OmpR family, phosphate regulon sensor histidine kinase PhoR
MEVSHSPVMKLVIDGEIGESVGMATESRLRANRVIATILPVSVAVILYYSDLLPTWLVALIALGSVPSLVRLAFGSEEHEHEAATVQPEPVQATSKLDGLAPAIIDSLPDALLAVDQELLVLETNQAARSLLGEGLRGRNIGLSLRRPAALQAIEEALEKDETVSLDLSLLTPGEQFFVMQVIPLTHISDREVQAPISNDLVGGAVVILHDVTTQRRSEQMRADFVTNASHELRTPLASLVGFIETLQTSAADDAEARTRFLDIMARESGRMSRLIDDLLSLSRIELDEHIQPVGTVLVDQVLKTVGEMLEQRALDHQMTIEIKLPNDLPPIRGDADQITQVFQNLVDNAIKYGEENSVIEVKGHAVDRLSETGLPGIAIEVINQGDVIPVALVPRLTDRFFRVDSARSRTLGSTGLGLAIVKHIVSRHRGTLSVKSDDVSGTKITVSLPIAS